MLAAYQCALHGPRRRKYPYHLEWADDALRDQLRRSDQHWRPRYVVQAAQGYLENPTTYPYHRRVYILAAGTNYFRIEFLPNEGVNTALSDVQNGDILVLSATSTITLSNYSSKSIAGNYLQFNPTGNWGSLAGQYGWVFGTHAMEDQPNSANDVLVGSSQQAAFAPLAVWGPDTASTTAFTVVNSASTTEFTVYDTGNAVLAGSLTQNSDIRLKTNISDLDGSSSLAEINALNPVTFNWIDPNKSSVPQFGFIAQQVQQVFPNLVSTTSPTALTPDGTLSLELHRPHLPDRRGDPGA